MSSPVVLGHPLPDEAYEQNNSVSKEPRDCPNTHSDGSSVQVPIQPERWVPPKSGCGGLGPTG